MILAILFCMACDGKPCSQPPDYAKADEQVVESLDDMLKKGNAYENQRTRVLEINAGLDPNRRVFRRSYEHIRVRLIDQLVAVTPDVDVFHALLYDLHATFMRYVYAVIDVSVTAHRWFTNDQRKAMTKDWEEPPDDYTIPWSVKRGIDLAMLEIKATDEQKTQVKALRDDMEKKTDKLLKDQHAVRMKLIAEWHATKIDPAAVRTHIDEGALQISMFVHKFADHAFEVNAAFTPQQRMWTNKQVNKLRRCPAEVR